MWALLLPIAYLIGTFPSAALVARANGIDIRSVGSGNPGASNVTRVLGWRKGVWVFVLDAAKGALAAGIGLAAGGRPAGYALGAAAVLGHVFPVWQRFRGGKGVATGGGIAAVMSPIAFALLVLLWFVISQTTKKASVASIAVVALLPGRRRDRAATMVGGARHRGHLHARDGPPSRQHQTPPRPPRARPLTARPLVVAMLSDSQFGQQRRQVDVVEAGQVHVDRVVQQVLPEVVAEEVPALAHHVVQQEEAVRLLEEQHLLRGERVLGVVGAQEPLEPRLEQGVARVRERRAITGA